MNAHLITIGDEILIGQIVDTNSAWMAQQLNLQGVRVTKIISISDTIEAIQEGLVQSFAETDLVIMTGGLGPTKDDITKKALAAYFKVGMIFSEETFSRIEKMFANWGRSTTPAHREQCYMPANAALLTNKVGTAPGMWLQADQKVVVSLPGIPYEMKYLMEHEVLPKIKLAFPGMPIAHRTILTIGEGETRIAQRIEKVENDLPDHIKLAYLPSLGKVRLRLTATGSDQEVIETDLDAQVEKIKLLIPEFIFGYDEMTIEGVIGQMLMAKGKSLSTAESCTGGYLAHRITSIPGSSAYFKGSVVAYANEIKTNLLDVTPEILAQHGAVSEETVSAMVKGVIQHLNTDIGAAISGIAGPGGGTADKPVGTIWLAVGDRNKTRTLKLQLGKTRLKNIEYTANKAMDLIRQFLLTTD